MKTVLNVVYAVVGLIGLFIFVVAVVCISVHIYHCCSRHRRKQSDAVGDTCSRPSASSTVVDCQYVTLQTADGTAVPSAPLHTQAGSHESVELQPFACPGNGHSDVKPPTYDEVMGYRWACCYKMRPLLQLPSVLLLFVDLREVIASRWVIAICWCWVL